MNGKVLLVEDNPDNADVVVELFELATNVSDALQLVQDQHFSLILLDMRLPLQPGGIIVPEAGLMAAKQIRALPNGKDAHLVALTASVMPNEVQKMRTAGIARTITKPFKLDAFLTMINEFSPKETRVQRPMAKENVA